jgi:hypothetical protein
MIDNPKDRAMVEKCCELIARCAQLEAHRAATPKERTEFKSDRMALVEQLMQHVAWARADERLKAEMGKGGAS